MSAIAVERPQTQGSSSPQEPTPAQVVIGAGLGFIVSSCMQTVTKLAIPDFIAKGTSQVADLAEKAAFPEDALYRVLRVLEMAGIVRETSSRSFALTNAGSLPSGTMLLAGMKTPPALTRRSASTAKLKLKLVGI